MPIRFSYWLAHYGIHLRASASSRQLVAVLGTGISTAYFEKNGVRIGNGATELNVDWITFLSLLRERCAKKVPNAQSLLTAIKNLMAPNADLGATGYLGLAYSMKAELESAGPSEWRLFVESVFEQVNKNRRANQHWTDWLRFVSRHGIVCTTNYDDLATGSLDSLALLSIGAEPGRESQLETARLLSGGNRPVPDHLNKLDFATDFWTAQRVNLLQDNDRFVHHLHGHHREPAGMVLDAADYASQKGWVMEDQIIRALADGHCYFFGVGEGMFDPHFTRLITRAAELRRTRLNQPMYRGRNSSGIRGAWFLADERNSSGSSRRQYEDFIKRYGQSRLRRIERVIKIVEFDVRSPQTDFDAVPRALLAATKGLTKGSLNV